MRNDVLRLATEAARKTNGRLDTEMLYNFFLEVCKAEKIRPKDLNPEIDGNWLKVGNNSKISIEPVHFSEPIRRSWASDNEPDYEEMILARQEAIYND